MAIESLADLSDLSWEQLYAVYLAIAKNDHSWRLQTMYGDEPVPQGHAEFRPLSQLQFNERISRAQGIAGGESMLRVRLARQAAAYQVDVPGVLTLRSAA